MQKIFGQAMQSKAIRLTSTLREFFYYYLVSGFFGGFSGLLFVRKKRETAGKESCHDGREV